MYYCCMGRWYYAVFERCFRSSRIRLRGLKCAAAKLSREINVNDTSMSTEYRWVRDEFRVLYTHYVQPRSVRL